MPLYDYECPACGHILENVLQGFHDSAPLCSKYIGEHPDYDNEHEPTLMVKMVVPTSFRLQGKGWPDKDRQERKERFVKRNKRIEKMTPEQQDGFKKIIDSTGGDRYIP